MVIVDIFAPSLDKTYNFMLDEDSTVELLMIEIIEMIDNREGLTSPFLEGNFVLCDRDREIVLDPSKKLGEQVIETSANLVLV